MTDTHRPIRVLPEHEPPFETDLAALIAIDDGIAEDADAITAALDRNGEWIGGGGAAPFFTIVALPAGA